MKVKELVEKLKAVDQELEVVLPWDAYNCNFEADLAYVDQVTTCLGLKSKVKGFYSRADDELGNPIYPAVDLKELCFIG
jgi:hypothetical protein